MRAKSFQSTYSKLYLVTEDVYSRILHCISDKTEEDELKKLNETREADNEISSENLINPESNPNSSDLNEIHQNNQIPENRDNRDNSLQTDVEDSRPSNESDEIDEF